MECILLFKIVQMYKIASLLEGQVAEK